MKFYETWRKFIDEPALLREIDEEELDHIADFLRDMGENDLPFEQLFGSDMRVLIPFEKKLMPYRLQDFENRMSFKPNQPGSWEVNFDTGIVRREIWSNLDGFGDNEWFPVPLNKSFEKANEEHRAKLEKEGWKFKTQQMKIGKFLTKYMKLKEKAEKARWTPKPGTNEIDYDAYEKLQGKLYDFAGSYFGSAMSSAHAQEILDSWAQGGGKSTPLAIVLSRHPIDILRMADYEHIQSCHSPRSRGGGGEYYHCAVADAHGHGAIAYLVNKEHIEWLYDKKLEPGKHDRELYALDNEEIFSDKARNLGGIDPVARVRIRRFIYSKEGKEVEKQWTGEIAIPEDRIYGPDVTGFLEEIKNYLRQNQEGSIKDLPDDLSKTALIGGTYFDTAPKQMFSSFLSDREFQSVPQVITDVEEEIMGTLGLNTVSEFEQAIQGLQNDYRPVFKVDGFRRILVAANAEDDGAGSAYIDVNASMQFL